jgi:anti-sigma B factor antagonist
MTIKIREQGPVLVFDIEGEIRRTDTVQETLHGLVEANLNRGRRNVLFNMGGVEFIDSFGVGQILASYISIQKLGGKLKLCRISPKLLLIFQITMLHKVLDIQEDCDRALESFGKS